MTSPLLQVQDCSLSFGGIKALVGLSFSLEAGGILGVIGPNGAGKTTFFNILTGVYAPDEGQIKLEDHSIKGALPFKISRLGIARTFQNIRLFQNLSVYENVLTAHHSKLDISLWQSLLRTSLVEEMEEKAKLKTRELMELFGLWGKKDEEAKNLPYGDQRKLEIVRALATSPKLLLLDEPAAGMNKTEKNELIGLIGKIRSNTNLSTILIEHDMTVVMKLCPRIIVLDYGEKIAEGSPEEIRHDPRVIEAYLGHAPA